MLPPSSGYNSDSSLLTVEAQCSSETVGFFLSFKNVNVMNRNQTTRSHVTEHGPLYVHHHHKAYIILIYITGHHIHNRSRDSSVIIGTRLWIQRFPAGTRLFFSCSQPCIQLIPLSVPRGLRRGGDHLSTGAIPPFSHTSSWSDVYIPTGIAYLTFRD
jgi:hypothetical protein